MPALYGHLTRYRSNSVRLDLEADRDTTVYHDLENWAFLLGRSGLNAGAALQVTILGDLSCVVCPLSYTAKQHPNSTGKARECFLRGSVVAEACHGLEQTVLSLLDSFHGH